jgi:hypothetical protein
MTNLKRSLVLLGLVLLCCPAFAQEEEATSNFTYATYFYCDVAGQDQADELFKKNSAPVLDAMVKDGVISGWGWLAHHTGGQWRRIQYYQADSVNGLLDAQTEMNKRMAAANPTPDNTFGKICSAHEDYIWEVVAGAAGDSRGEAGFSVYYTCDQSQEERADEIFKKDFAPVFDKFVADGKFSSWGWSSHLIGGEYRRLQTMTAKDFKSLLNARTELIDEMYKEGFEAGAEFNSICNSHVDYLWDIQVESRGEE